MMVSNGKDLTVLFKMSLSWDISKLSLISKLILLESLDKMVKSSKFMLQSQVSKWSEIADCLTFLRRLFVNHLYPCGSRPGILYGMAKVHKPVINWCPSLQWILSAINTPSYKLVKFLVPLLTFLTSNDFSDSFSFAEEVSSFDCAHYMTSFDIESLFTNIPLEKTINICDDKRFENNTKVT